MVGDQSPKAGGNQNQDGKQTRTTCSYRSAMQSNFMKEAHTKKSRKGGAESKKPQK